MTTILTDGVTIAPFADFSKLPQALSSFDHKMPPAIFLTAVYLLILPGEPDWEN